MKRIAEQIVNDLSDSGMPDAIVDFHTANGNLSRLEHEAPTLHASVLEEIEAWRAKEAAA